MRNSLIWLFLLIGLTANSQTYSWYEVNQFENDSMDQNLSGGIVVDSENNIWVNGPRGLFKITASTFCTIYNSTNSPYRAGGVGLCVDTLGHIWIGNGGSLLEFDGDTTWNVYNGANSGHPGSKIIDMKIDTKGNIWCVFSFKGIGKFSNGEFTLYNQSNSQIPTDATNRIAIDKDDNVWISTMIGGLIKFDQQNFTFYSTLANGQPIPPLIALHADKNGHIWGGCYSNGIFHYDKSTFKVEKPNNLSRLSINKIIEDSSGSVWFFSSESNVISYDGSNWNSNIGNSTSQFAGFVGAHFDNESILWVTSNDKGLLQLAFDSPEFRKKETSIRNGTNKKNEMGVVSVYPNPSLEKTLMRYSHFQSQVTICVFDANGKIVTSFRDLPESGEVSLSLKLKGVFFVYFVSENYSTIKKLILL